jgi:RNA methyltransferase, TrmH family
VPEQPRPPEGRALITSPTNEQARFVKSLYRTIVRRNEKLFVVEGVRLLEEALTFGARPELVLVAAEQLARTPRGAALLERLRTCNCLNVTETVLKTISDTVAPQGAIAIFPVPDVPARLSLGPVVLILDGLRDPGNAGTILRSADASGIVQTVAFVDSIDPYSPKVVRAAMGAHFRLTILEDARWNSLRPLLADRPRYLAVAAGPATYYDKIDWTGDCALVIGGEAEGAGSQAEAAVSERVIIPMAGSAESLNAAMAGTILLFEAARERRAQGLPTVPVARPAAARPPFKIRTPEAPPAPVDQPAAPVRRPAAPRRPSRPGGPPRRPVDEGSGPRAPEAPRPAPQQTFPASLPEFIRRRRLPPGEGSAGAKPTRPRRPKP